MFDADWTFATVSSDDLQGTGDANVFSNVLRVPIRFNSDRVQVALWSIIYQLTTGSETVYHVNTNLVPATQHVGSLLANSIRQVTLVADDTDHEWNPVMLKWLPAQLDSDGVSLIQVQFTQPDGSDATGFKPKSDLVFVFRSIIE